ncbi:MAG: hypothetical protein JWM46_564 [Candidatus Kaiserbacteria bacterium]|nr:hypothetical protein [Candidatus Kaiserbacteria bacterium]
MQYSYDKASVQIEFWLVTKSDLKRLYEFFQGRGSPTFSLETLSGDNREYDSFAEFESDLEVLLADRETVTLIHVGCSETTANWRKHAWISIGFESNMAHFHVTGNDKKRELKDWVEATYSGIQKLAGLFEIEDEDLRRFIAPEYDPPNPKIIFDPLENIRRAYEATKTPIVPPPESEHVPQIIQIVTPKSSRFSMVTNNATLSIIIASIILFGGAYCVYRIFGVDPSNLSSAGPVIAATSTTE